MDLVTANTGDSIGITLWPWRAASSSARLTKATEGQCGCTCRSALICRCCGDRNVGWGSSAIVRSFESHGRQAPLHVHITGACCHHRAKGAVRVRLAVVWQGVTSFDNATCRWQALVNRIVLRRWRRVAAGTLCSEPGTVEARSTLERRNPSGAAAPTDEFLVGPAGLVARYSPRRTGGSSTARSKVLALVQEREPGGTADSRARPRSGDGLLFWFCSLSSRRTRVPRCRTLNWQSAR